MFRSVSFVLFFLLSFGASYAAAQSLSRAPLHRLQNHCLNHDFSKITCQELSSSGDLYENAETFQSRFQHVAARLLVRTFVWHLPPPGGGQLVREFHGRLRGYAQEKRLNTCQRIALSACAVNQVLEYGDELVEPGYFWDRLLVGLVHPQEFYYSANSRGICTEFCALYAQIGRVLGLQVHELANGLHCFNRVRQGAGWIYVEPQEGGRQPYYLNSNRFYLLGL